MSSDQPTTPASESNTPGGPTGATGGAQVPTTPSATSGTQVPATPTANPTSTTSSSTNFTSTPTIATMTAAANKYGFKPPIMGGVNEYVKGTHIPFTGGAPNYLWKGLQRKATAPTSPNQIRPIYASDSQKAYKYRKEGCTIKFKKGDSLLDFQKRMNKYLQDHGLDTIAYLPDVDSTTMMNIVDSHARFTEDYVQAQEAKYKQHYDEYDKSNTVAAREALLNSVEESIAQDLERLLEGDDGFLVAWITLVREIQTMSYDRFDTLKVKIRNMRATDYPQQNIKSMVEDYEKAAKELVSAGQYEHNLTLDMINAFIAAGGEPNEDWKAPLRVIKERLEEALVTLGFHRTKEQEDKFMTKEKLTYKHICKTVRSRYKRKVEKNEWPPNQTPTDSRRLPKQYAALAMNNYGKNKDSSQIICYHCGKPGHVKANCPQLNKDNDDQKKSSGKVTPKSSNKQSSGAWRFVAPKDGEAETITKNKKTFHWCAKCGRWTTTHSTATHKGKNKEKGKGKGRSKAKVEANLAAEEVESDQFDNLDQLGAWSTECNNHKVLTWIRILMFMWIGLAMSIIAGAIGVIKGIISHVITSVMNLVWGLGTSVLDFYSRSPTLMTCITKIVTTFIGLGKVLTTLFSTQELWFLAPLSWMIVAYLSIKFSPSSVVERVKIVKAGRSQLRMTDFMRFKYRQGKMSHYFKMKSTKKQSKLKRKFISCETRPERNVKTRLLASDNGHSDTVRDVGHAAVLARKDRRTRRHQHQRTHAAKTKLRTLINRHLMHCELHNNFNHSTKSCFKPIRNYDLVNKKWEVIRPEWKTSHSGDKYHHIVTKLPSVFESPHKTSFESLNRRKRRNIQLKAQKKRERMAEQQLRKQIAVAKSIIDRTYEENKKFDYMNRATMVDYLSDYSAFSTALLSPFTTLCAYILPTAKRIFETAPSEAARYMTKKSKFMVIWDTGASTTISNAREDFGDTYVKATTIDVISGISKGLKVVGKGMVKWNVQDSTGEFRTLELPALHVPTCGAKLISCSSLLQKYKGETITMTDNQLTYLE